MSLRLLQKALKKLTPQMVQSARSKYWWNQGLAAWFRAKSTILHREDIVFLRRRCVVVVVVAVAAVVVRSFGYESIVQFSVVFRFLTTGICCCLVVFFKFVKVLTNLYIFWCLKNNWAETIFNWLWWANGLLFVQQICIFPNLIANNKGWNTKVIHRWIIRHNTQYTRED